MSQARRLPGQLQGLRGLVTAQRLLKAALRAAWLAGAGLLAGWALAQLSGTIIPPILAYAAAGLLALIGIVPIFWQWPSLRRFVWRLDRLLGLKEQVSTAWSVPPVESGASLGPALQQDVLALLPGVRRRILLRGWNTLGEVISLLVVLALGGAIYMGSVPASPLGRLNAAQAAQPPAFTVQEASRADVLPRGILSLDTLAQTAPTPGAPSQAAPTPSTPSQAADLALMSQALQQVGQQLSQQAASYELGQALQKQDFAKAADQLEQVADKLGSLSQDTRSQLADAMAQAAEALKNQKPAGQMAADLNQAASALTASQPASEQPPAGQTSPRDAMDKVANDLRDLNAQAAGGGAGQPQSGSANGSGTQDGGGTGAGRGASLSGGGPKQGAPASLTRLEGESGDFKLDINDPSLAGILVPGPTTGTGTTTAGGAANQTGATSGETNQAVLFPYSYDWKWQALIAQYFQRGQ